VASVLPDEPPEEVPIKAESGIVQRPVTSWIPMGVMLLVVMGLASPLWWWWLRRGPTQMRQPVEPDVSELPIDQWSAAGEHRAVLAAASDTLRHALADHVVEVPESGDVEAWVESVERATEAPWDGPAVVALLRDIDRVRFQPEDPGTVLGLYHRSLEVASPPREVVGS
jgi:hypothetical protein